jgi:hypothetical protein
MFMKSGKTTFKTGIVFVLMALAALTACSADGGGKSEETKDGGKKENPLPSHTSPTITAVERVYDTEKGDRIKVSWTADVPAGSYLVYLSEENTEPKETPADISPEDPSTAYISPDPSAAYDVWVGAVYGTPESGGEDVLSVKSEPVSSPSKMTHTVNDAATLSAVAAVLQGSKVVSHTVNVTANVDNAEPFTVSDAVSPPPPQKR